MDILLELNHISKKYKTAAEQVEVLSDLCYDIRKGDFIVISGASGSGKSTLLNIIGCIDKPTSGSLCFAGNDITHIPLEALNVLRLHHIGYIFQSFNLIPVLNAYENVEFPLLFRYHNRALIQERVTGILERVGLKERMYYRPSGLSGGQRQRVAIARALAGSPSLIIADEPTANLDKDTAVSIIALLQALNEEYGVTIVLATHDPLLTGYARTKLHLKNGRLIQASEK